MTSTPDALLWLVGVLVGLGVVASFSGEGLGPFGLAPGMDVIVVAIVLPLVVVGLVLLSMGSEPRRGPPR